jgi:hypothetical protein
LCLKTSLDRKFVVNVKGAEEMPGQTNRGLERYSRDDLIACAHALDN